MLPMSHTFPIYLILLSLTSEGFPISLILYASLYEGLVAHVASAAYISYLSNPLSLTSRRSVAYVAYVAYVSYLFIPLSLTLRRLGSACCLCCLCYLSV